MLSVKSPKTTYHKHSTVCTLSLTYWFHFPSLNHMKILQSPPNCRFLLQRTLRYFSIFWFRLIIIISLNNSTLPLYLCDIEIADLQTCPLFHIRFNLLICSLALRSCQIHLVMIQFCLNMMLDIKFGTSQGSSALFVRRTTASLSSAFAHARLH